MLCQLPVVPEMSERPSGFIAPNLSPRGLRLIPEQLAEGVYALMANEIPKDNNGLIVGDEAALIVDAGVTPGIGEHIQRLSAELTDRPIRFLANTTFHGDHTFGNAAFGADVTIISARLNKAAMTDLEVEKRIRRESMYGDPDALDEVLTWRAPDVVFDRFCEIDLGGRVVQLWHFGTGNGSGDTIVYVPDAKVAWTGNFLGKAGIAPMLLVGDPIGYLGTLRAMRATLEITTMVPGHGFRGDAEPAISWMITYLERLATTVTRRKEAGEPVETLLEEIPLRDELKLPVDTPNAEQFTALNHSLHRLNVLATYRWLQGALTPRLG